MLRMGGDMKGKGGDSGNDGDFEDFEEPVYFVDCTCAHGPEEHGWGECLVKGCDCKGGW